MELSVTYNELDVWKKFDESEITHSGIHHLMAVYYLLKEHGYARGIDIARFLNITRGSVSSTISKLKKRGYITEDKNHFYRLTTEGLETVETVIKKRSAIKDFFIEVLGLPEDTATIDACKIEHLLSQSTIDNLREFHKLYLGESREARKFRSTYKKNCLGLRKI
jgi:DtxR family Mn-dependent transcriptional regulator